MEKITLKLPLPPSINHYWLSSRNRRYLSARAREFRNQVCIICAQSKATKRIDTPIELRVLFIYPDKRRRDYDNMLKPLQDALMHAGVIVDDSQIRAGRQIVLNQIEKPGCCYVQIMDAPIDTNFFDD